MEYREIVSVTGMSGLYQLLATKSDGAIVRSLQDKSTKFIPARTHNVTPLESIEIYTTGPNVRLHEVLEAIKDQEATHPMVDVKTVDNSGIKNYLKTVYPSLDEERVYVSDMKKMLRWYELLKANDLLNFEKYKETSEAETPELDVAVTAAEVVPEEVKEEKPKKKAATKKKSAAKAETDEASSEPKKTAPKKAAKKKTEE